MKIFWIILTLVIVALAAAMGGGYYYWQTNKDDLMAMGDEAQIEGTALGKQLDENGCLSEVIKKNDSCEGFMCKVKINLMMSTCLKASKKVPGFCDNIPNSTELMDSVTWSLEKCQQLGRPADEDCARVVREAQDYCHSKE